jgi:mono/diheme cytochrome c family protein
VFKTPGLRNVALTAPYFHDASAASLEQAVIIMAYTQAGVVLPWREAQSIAAFLRTLTGELDGIPLTDIVPLPPQTNIAALSAAEQGATMFGAYCAMCHAAPAHSARGTAINSQGALPLTAPAGEMPASHAEFSVVETRLLDAFLR